MTTLTEYLDSALAARAALLDADHAELVGTFHTELMGTFHTELVGNFHTAAYRLFNGFLEGFPALSLDIYAQTALIHSELVGTSHDNGSTESSAHIATAQAWILEKLPWVTCILLKTRERHTTEQSRGQLLFGSQPADRLLENGVWYALDLEMNRDASFYLDTRNLRSWAKANLAGKTILNTFAYTGSLGVAALAGGAARVVQMDRNARYLALARQSCALNGLPTSNQDFLAQDFFPAISQLKQQQQSFDCVFLDPPFFATTTKGRVDLETGSTRLINKVRPLIKHGGWLVAINNALFVSGQQYLASLEALCADGYLEIEELIPVPSDLSGYPQTRQGQPPCDPAPFNHSTKIAVLRVRRKIFGAQD